MRPSAANPEESLSPNRTVSDVVPLGWAPDQIVRDHGITLYLDGAVNVDDILSGIDEAGSLDLWHRMIRLYKRHGIGVLDRLRGSFAIAFWDSEERRLLMAVDPFGTRTLFYSQVGDAFAFSPRLSPFCSWGKFRSEIDPNIIYFYLNHAFVPGPFTVYRAARRLEPGQYLQWQAGSFRLQCYWQMNYPEEKGMTESAGAEILRDAVEDSVRYHLTATRDQSVSRGAFLSGGTDSSTVVGLLSRITSERVRTFSVGFSEAAYNEIDYARIAATHFDAEPHEHFVTPDEALEAIPVLARAFDEPFGNSSAIPTYFCAKMASEVGLTVLFAGDGGDELFAGNERYLTEKVFTLYHKVPSPLRWPIDQLAELFPPISPFTKVSSYIRKANLPPIERFFSYQLYFKDHADEYFSDDFRRSLDLDFPISIHQKHYLSAGKEVDPLNRLLYMDLKLAIADNDLFKVNRSAEVFGVRIVYPYLDKVVALTSARIPACLKLKGWAKRYIFKKAFMNLLPNEILTKKKHGFGLPTGDWLRTHFGFRDLARSLLLDQRSINRGYFRRKALEDLLQRHDTETTSYYGSQIWNVMMLELWHRCHLDI